MRCEIHCHLPRAASTEVAPPSRSARTAELRAWELLSTASGLVSMLSWEDWCARERRTSTPLHIHDTYCSSTQHSRLSTVHRHAESRAAFTLSAAPQVIPCTHTSPQTHQNDMHTYTGALAAWNSCDTHQDLRSILVKSLRQQGPALRLLGSPFLRHIGISLRPLTSSKRTLSLNGLLER